jgi:CDP-glucose 4,6-dehydratase
MEPVIGITGASGFIGTHLAAMIPKAFQFPYPDIDLRDRKNTIEWVKQIQPDILYHLAAQAVVTNQDDLESLETNIAGTYNLLHACHKHAKNLKSFVNMSSDKVYGNNALAETRSPLIGVNHPYNASKLCGDVIAQMYASYYGLPIRIIRSANIYGPGDLHFDRIIPGTIQAALQGKPIELRSNGSFTRDYIYVGDVVPAIARIANEPQGIYNFGGQLQSVLGVVQIILEQMGRLDLQPVIMDNQRNEIQSQHVVDCPAWWNPTTSLKDGIQETIKWHLNQA